MSRSLSALCFLASDAQSFLFNNLGYYQLRAPRVALDRMELKQDRILSFLGVGEAGFLYGKYFASKIRAGVTLESFKKGKSDQGKKEAIEELKKASAIWKNMVELAERYNVEVIPHQFDFDFSWRKHIQNVEKDIVLAENY